MRRSRGKFATENRCVRSWQSAPCEVARHKARGGADRKAQVHRDGIAPRRKPYPRTHSSLFRLLAQHPYAGQATDLPGVRRLTVSPYPYLIFYPSPMPRLSSSDASHVASAALRVRHALTCAARQPVKWAERLVRRSSTSERGSDTHPMHQFVTGTRWAFWFCLSQAIARRVAVAPFPCPSFARPQWRKP